MKKFTILLAAIVSLMLNAGTVKAQSTFEKVNASLADWSGEYLLVFEDATAVSCAFSGVDAVNGYTEVSPTDGVITASGLVTLTVAPMEGGYSIQVNGGDNDGKYIYGQSGSNTLKFADEPSLNTISHDGESVMIVSYTSVMRFNSASNQMRFRYYKETTYASQQPVQLYKKNDGAPVTPTVSTPTFSPAAGTYLEPQQVSIQCATVGATIRYTLDGTNPTVNSSLYSAPLTISETTTVKAIAMKAGMQNSGVATATYTIQEGNPILSIAEAKALSLNEYATVQGVVTFIDGKNVYVQDATAGIDLYLTANAPATLALGDLVQAYGKRAAFNGLIELSGINPSDENQFAVLSSGNELPLAVKTIAEVLVDHANGTFALQSTRIQIVGAEVGTINNNNNTPISQNDQILNIYKMPVVEGLTEGDVITVIGIVGCYNNPQLRVNSAEDVLIHGDAVTYNKVMHPNDIFANGSYLLVCEAGSTAASGLVQNNALQTVGVTINANTISTTTGEAGMPCLVVLEAAEGGYYVKINGSYLNNSSGTGVSLGAEPLSVWVANAYEEGGYILQNTSNNNRFIGGATAEGLTYKAYATSNLGAEQYPVVVLYKEGGSAPMPQVETPVITPAGGLVMTPQQVSISCATEGATIHYTLDGSNPTEESLVYGGPITVSTTTTIKAMAVKEGLLNSAIASATFTFPTPISIAEAHALDNGEFGLVQGVVTFIDGRNIYVQDATAGIVLYLNLNTVPETLAVGDLVQGYGKKSVYKGLIELSDIDGLNESNFKVISTGNALPLAVKTIEQCLAGAADALQSTRVQIQDAVIGAINTGGNTTLTQGTQTMNIYRIPALNGIEENDHVNVIGVIGFYNNAQLRVASANDVVALNANLTVNPMTLEGFSYEQGEGPSATQTFTINGQYLEETVNLSIPEYYEMSLAPNTSFSTTLSLPTTDGVLDETTVYVRLMANLLMDNYESVIQVVSGEDETTVALSGSVIMSNAVATPSFTPAGGQYMTPQTVSIACTTNGALIHYTIDGSDPTENSPVYTEPIEVTGNMVIKAMGTKQNWMSSLVATASYEILTPMLIRDARQLENNEYATVEGVVTLIDNRNIYVQDNTGGIVLYLNNNTVPETLALGDRVRAYGKKSVYSGLVELSGINGGNENAFMTISTGNPLPMRNKNIATLLEDYAGANTLQATRVHLVSAIVRSINYNGNTVIEQGDNQLSIYKMPEMPDMREGDFIDVTGVVGCHNGVQLLVAEASDVVYQHRPLIQVTTTSLSGIDYELGHGPSTIVALSVNGDCLNSYIRVQAPEHYELSVQGGNDFQATPAILFFPQEGVVEGAMVYVRLKADLPVGSYNEALTITSQGADEVHVDCSGNVFEQGGSVTTDWRKIYNLSELVEGSRVIVAARYDNENTDSYYAMTAVTSGKPEGVLFTSAMSGSDEVLPASITGQADTYCWTLGKIGDLFTFTNNSGSTLGYSSSTNFATGGDNIGWSITEGTSIDTGVMVSNYAGYNIINGNVTNRAFALNNNHNYGPYSTSNMTNGNGANYNFYLDIFISSTGGTPTVSAPMFDPEAGTYYETLAVTIASATDDAIVYYSTESAEGPWTVYEAPVTVDQSMTLWAYAEKEGFNSSAVVSAEYVIHAGMNVLFNQDWEGDWNGWTQVNVIGEAHWSINSYSGNHYAYANAYNQGATEAWLISPAFDLDANPGAILNFRTARNYNGPDIDVFFSNDYDGADPSTATWQAIQCELSTGSWEWVLSGDLSLSGFSGNNCHIAYRYTATDDLAAGWEVDDIMLYSGGGSSDEPYINVTPNELTGFVQYLGEGPTDAQTFEVSGGNLLPAPGGGYGPVWLTVSGNEFQISLDNMDFTSQLSIDAEETLDPTTIYVRLSAMELGHYEATVTIEASSVVEPVTVSLSGDVIDGSDLPYLDVFMPYYIQGMNGSNNNRVPVAIATYVGNLEPNTTYRYVNQFVDDNDGPETAGAGNVIYADPDGFYRTTSPSLSTEGGYGEFTTDGNGEAFVWFMNEPTANTRFTPGNHVYLRIRINDGHDGTTVSQILTTEDYATVLSFGNEAGANQGTAFYAASEEDPKTFVMMFSNDMDMRPTYSTSIETTGVDYGSINQYADFYKEEVAGKNGYFGGILPNDNADGINIIWILDMESYVINDYYTEDGQGHWGTTATANPTAGLDEPLFIDLISLNVEEGVAMDVKVWNYGHEIMVENAEDSRLEMVVYNLLGQPVLTKTIAAQSSERISHNLADGMYVITLSHAQDKMSAKVVVR